MSASVTFTLDDPRVRRKLRELLDELDQADGKEVPPRPDAPVAPPPRRKRGPSKVRPPRPEELANITPITQAMVAGDARRKGLMER